MAVWHRRYKCQLDEWSLVISNGKRLGYPTWQTIADLHSNICVVDLTHVCVVYIFYIGVLKWFIWAINSCTWSRFSRLMRRKMINKSRASLKQWAFGECDDLGSRSLATAGLVREDGGSRRLFRWGKRRGEIALLGCIVAARITIVYISSLEISEASQGTELICLQHFATSSMKKYIPVPVDIGPVSLPAIPKLIDTYLQDLHRLFHLKSIWGRKRLRNPRLIIGSPMIIRLVSLCYVNIVRSSFMVHPYAWDHFNLQRFQTSRHFFGRYWRISKLPSSCLIAFPLPPV